MLSCFHISCQSPSVPVEAAEQLLNLTHSLRKTNDPTVRTSLPSTLACFPYGRNLNPASVPLTKPHHTPRRSLWPRPSPPDSCWGSAVVSPSTPRRAWLAPSTRPASPGPQAKPTLRNAPCLLFVIHPLFVKYPACSLWIGTRCRCRCHCQVPPQPGRRLPGKKPRWLLHPRFAWSHWTSRPQLWVRCFGRIWNRIE